MDSGDIKPSVYTVQVSNVLSDLFEHIETMGLCRWVILKAFLKSLTIGDCRLQQKRL